MSSNTGSKKEKVPASSNKKKNSRKRESKKKIQYTKIIINMIIFLVLLTTISSIYVNYKNGLGLDSVVSSCWEALKYIIPSYCAKSFFETKEEMNNINNQE